MPTSPTSFLSEIVDAKAEIPEGKLAYFRERLKHELYDFVVSGFLEKEKTHQLSKSDLARRLHKSREQITRWLASPGNWEIDTISDLTLAIFCGELKFSIQSFAENQRRNSDQLSLLHSTAAAGPSVLRSISSAPASTGSPSFQVHTEYKELLHA